MKRKIVPCLAVALTALAALAGPATFAATPDPAPATAAAPQLPLFVPEAQAAMGNGNGNNMCNGQFTEITNYYFFVLSPEECDTTCTNWCDGEGGTLVSAAWSARGADCFCTCCVAK
jgi:hypothetical protein